MVYPCDCSEAVPTVRLVGLLPSSDLAGGPALGFQSFKYYILSESVKALMTLQLIDSGNGTSTGISLVSAASAV